jgi:hypothetical protein
MPHLGKAFPRQFINLVLNPFTIPTPGPTRNLVINNLNSFAVGTVAEKWKDQRVISTVAERDPIEPTWTKYTWTSPLDSSATIVLRASYGATVPPSTSFNRFSWIYRFAAFDGATEIASDVTTGDTAGLIWGANVGGLILDADWQVEPFPALWSKYRARVTAAQWADVPDYHPYRH